MRRHVLPVRPMPATGWAETIDTIHMWSQVIGKIKLAQMPFVNHWWQVTLHVSSRGLTTNAMPYGDEDGMFDIELDFVNHRLVARESGGKAFAMDLAPISVAAFYRALMDGLASLGISVRIRTKPVEVDVAIPFEEDEVHDTYDREHVERIWTGLASANEILTRFRSGFIGKCSPVHFFWGGFDLAVTRFSGRRAPQHGGGIPNCPDWVMVEAYSHEVSSAGWWPGTDATGPAFYSYMYPEPAGFGPTPLTATPGYYDNDLGEFLLTDHQADATHDPEATVLHFLEAVYDRGATLAAWDPEALERR